MYQESCRNDGTGTVYLTIGTAGTPLETTGFNSSIGDWSLAHTESYGFARLSADLNAITIQVCKSLLLLVLNRFSLLSTTMVRSLTRQRCFRGACVIKNLFCSRGLYFQLSSAPDEADRLLATRGSLLCLSLEEE